MYIIRANTPRKRIARNVSDLPLEYIARHGRGRISITDGRHALRAPSPSRAAP